jgi:enoyl-CoA hydratase/carnithine racemase
MIMTARTVDAEEAQRIGLVHRLIDGDPMAQGIAFAREFSGYSLPVLGYARDAVRHAAEHRCRGLGSRRICPHSPTRRGMQPKEWRHFWKSASPTLRIAEGRRGAMREEKGAKACR